MLLFVVAIISYLLGSISFSIIFSPYIISIIHGDWLRFSVSVVTNLESIYFFVLFTFTFSNICENLKIGEKNITKTIKNWNNKKTFLKYFGESIFIQLYLFSSN